MRMATIEQKTYLKKYLSGSKKSKKVKNKPHSFRTMVIDDDIDISHLTTTKEIEDAFETNEDAPQVVKVVDHTIRLNIDDYTKSDMWKAVGSHNDEDSNALVFSVGDNHDQLLWKSGVSDNRDNSPPRKVKENDSSPPRRPKNSRYNDNQSLKKNIDYSPPRKIKNRSSSSPLNESRSGRKKSRWHDDSSPHRSVKDSSPKRIKSARNTDTSPVEGNSSQRTISKCGKDDVTPPQKRNDYTQSPRSTSRWNDSCPTQKNKISNEGSSSRRARSLWQDDSCSPPPASKQSSDISPRRRSTKTLTSPSEMQKPRKPLPGDHRGKYLIPAKRDKMEKTLDGKSAGLQNASELVHELEAHRAREDAIYQNMSSESLGIDSAPIRRDRKTGKVRDPEKEAEAMRVKQQREKETNEKYAQWGKGLKQVEDRNERLEQELHEMSKPLARYADDEDLERHLKEQLRDGDPMLAYIKKKKRKEAVVSGKADDKPHYQGECLPNRYGIRPGYRWDGVNRSNGYENKWFEKQNSKKAQQEEIYKWSTEDM